MPSSYPRRSIRQSRILAGIPLVVLALGVGEIQARSAERAASPAPSHSTRDLGHPASTGLEPCTSGSTTATTPAAGGQAPAAPASDEDLTATGSRSPASAQPQANTRGKGAVRDGGKRWFRRNDVRVVPPVPLEEPRRGGVGTLIGITFA